MGLDMYLNRMPRYNDTTVQDVSALEDYFSWKEKRENKASEARKYTLEKWCGTKYSDVPSGNIRKFYKQFYSVKYSHWDVEKKYGYGRIMEQVGYWRKANQIHNWFVKHVQDDIDDCNYHNEVTEYDLRHLLDICTRIMASCELVDGKVNNGYKYENSQRIPVMEDGKYIKDPSVAQRLLPSTSGFFFGGTDYDEYYLDDIKETIDIITNVLETTDFDTQMIYYISSW